MKIPQQSIPNDVMTGMFGIYARSLLIEKITKTAQNVCIGEVPIMDSKKQPLAVDIDTFKCLSHGFFADKHHIYGLAYSLSKNAENHYFTILKDADLASFEPISMLYGKDKNHFYYAEGGKTIKESGLHLLSAHTSKYQDENFPDLKATHTWSTRVAIGHDFVYNRGLKLKNADPQSFQQISQYYYSDQKHIYMANGYAIKALEKIDIPSFIVLSDSNPSMATDKYMPLICYNGNSKPEEWFKYYRKYFEELRHQISNDYWWYQLEKTMDKRT